MTFLPMSTLLPTDSLDSKRLPDKTIKCVQRKSLEIKNYTIMVKLIHIKHMSQTQKSYYRPNSGMKRFGKKTSKYHFINHIMLLSF